MNNTISSKLAALAFSLIVTGLIMGGVGYLFEIQSHPHLSVIARQRALGERPPGYEGTPYGTFGTLIGA